MSTKCTLAHAENADMIEVDENDSIGTVSLVRWVGGGDVSLDIIDIDKVFIIIDIVDDTLVTMIDLNKKIMKGMMCLRTKLISASYSLTSKFNIENHCKMKDN